MAYRFTPTDPWLRCSSGAFNGYTYRQSPTSYAALLKRRSVSAWQGITIIDDGSGSGGASVNYAYPLEFEPANNKVITAYSGAESGPTSTATFNTTVNWLIVGYTWTGTGAAGGLAFESKNGAGAWARNTATRSAGDATAIGSGYHFVIGNEAAALDDADFDLVCCGMTQSSLSQGVFESLDMVSFASWYSVFSGAGTWLIGFDAISARTDVTGNGGNEVDRSTTSAPTLVADPPGWSWALTSLADPDYRQYDKRHVSINPGRFFGTSEATLQPETVPGTSYTDTAVALVGLTPSGADVAVFADNSTVALKLTPSGTDAADYVDSNGATVTLTPSGADTLQAVDAGTVVLSLTPSTTFEEHATFDAATAVVLLTPSGTEQLSGSNTDLATVPLSLVPSGTDVLAGVDSNTAVVLLTAGGADVGAFSDVGTAKVALTPASTDTAQFVDNSTARLSFTPSSTDAFAASDSNTVPLLLIPAAAEGRESADSSVVPLALIPSGTDIALLSDTGTALVVFTVSGTDQLLGTATDAAVVVLTLGPFGTDTLQATDATTVPLKLTPSVTEVGSFSDSNQVSVVFTPSALEVPIYADSATAFLHFTPTGVEAGEDTATVLLRLVPSSTADIYAQIITDLFGVMTRKWIATATRKWTGLATRKWVAVWKH